MHIRPAIPSDYPVLQDIEVRAGELFREIGMDSIADDDPPTEEELADASAVLVAVDDAGGLVGYARIELDDGAAHLEQLSVLPEAGRQGVGTALLEAVADWARARGSDAVFLTTFRDVPFNGPLYEKRGFVHVPESEWSPGMRAAIDHQASLGMDRASRTVMRRDLG